MDHSEIAEILTVVKIMLAPLISSHEHRDQLLDRLDQILTQSKDGAAPYAEAFARNLREQIREEDRAAGRED